MEQVKVNPNLISDDTYDIGCSILATSIRSFFSRPDVKQKFEVWINTPDGVNAALTKRQRGDVEKTKS